MVPPTALRRRQLLGLLIGGVAAAGCLGRRSADDIATPEDWTFPDERVASDLVTFDPDHFDEGELELPPQGEVIDEEYIQAIFDGEFPRLANKSYRTSLSVDVVENDTAGTIRSSLWRNADTEQVYQRRIEEAPDLDAPREFRSYNDGTRFLYEEDEKGTEYSHVPEPARHLDRAYSLLTLPMVRWPLYAADEERRVGPEPMMRLTATEGRGEDGDVETAHAYVDTHGLFRYGRLEMSLPDFEYDGTFELLGGTPSISEPDWLDRAREEERRPIVPA